MIHTSIKKTSEGVMLPSVWDKLKFRADALNMDIYTDIQTIAGHGATHRVSWALVYRSEARPRVRYGACLPKFMNDQISDALAELEQMKAGE